MGFKKKSKVSAEFSMSSLTDIIFLLLIFFMLTSSLVTPNALNLKLPGKNSKPSTTKPSSISAISISKKGTFFLDGARINYAKLKTKMRDLKKAKGKDATVKISPNAKSSNDKVVAVLDLAYQYNIKTVLEDPKK